MASGTRGVRRRAAATTHLQHALHRSRQASPTNQASKLAAALWCEADAKCVRAGRHSEALLADKGCCRLPPPECVAPEPSGISDQSSKQACGCSSVRGGCKVCCLSGQHSQELRACLLIHTAAFPLAPALSGISFGQSRQRLAAALRCEADAKCVACLAGTRRSCLLACLLANAAAFLFALHRSRQGSAPANRGKGLRLLFGARRMQSVLPCTWR